ncbi:HpcH/HpaI aldolase/citrate lyase family protein [Amycolatopsis thermoflava]|uniref:HpcH/HpaI aldolase/citrate lyase family protein n=1 Tax=Amycolatopsis thermoflava TaxID=84480 RepID=UPI00040C49B0|nr:CoA ester lyase [Amycolatopsis thermoflava]
MKELEPLVRNACSLLVVPGHRPDRFPKAFASGADLVMLDIEDAVGPELKPQARKHIDDWLTDNRPAVVRINGVGTPWHGDDLAMVAEHENCVVMIPKAEHPDQVNGVRRHLRPRSVVIPALETATGILAAQPICSADGVVRIILGNADLSTDLGVDVADWDALRHARSHLVIASASAGAAPPLDGVTTALYDDELVRRESLRAAALGFTGKACLHPRQVAVVNDVFRPSERDVEWARNLLRSEGDGSVAAVEGQVVGKPILDRARIVLARAGLVPETAQEDR